MYINSLHQIVLSFAVLLLGILAQFIHGVEKSIKRGLLPFFDLNDLITWSDVSAAELQARVCGG